MTNLKQAILWPAFLSSAMSFVALLDLPYGYYQVLRIIIFGSAIYYIYINYNREQNVWSYSILGFIAILFNPIAPAYLDRSMWAGINILVGCYFLILAMSEYRSNNKQ